MLCKYAQGCRACILSTCRAMPQGTQWSHCTSIRNSQMRFTFDCRTVPCQLLPVSIEISCKVYTSCDCGTHSMESALITTVPIFLTLKNFKSDVHTLALHILMTAALSPVSVFATPRCCVSGGTSTKVSGHEKHKPRHLLVCNKIYTQVAYSKRRSYVDFQRFLTDQAVSGTSTALYCNAVHQHLCIVLPTAKTVACFWKPST